jgi:hypothetical protein
MPSDNFVVMKPGNTLFFAVRANRGFPSSFGLRNVHVIDTDVIPSRNDYDMFYIELLKLTSHKSLYNETLFYDFDLRIWLDADTPYDWSLNGWKMEIIQLPRGRGSQKLIYKFVDPSGNELMLNKISDTRNPSEFCRHISDIILQFQKASSLPSLFHHIGL